MLDSGTSELEALICVPKCTSAESWWKCVQYISKYCVNNNMCGIFGNIMVSSGHLAMATALAEA